MSRTQISIRLDSDVLDFLERNAARMREHVPGARITRADAARLLLEEARRSAGEPK